MGPGLPIHGSSTFIRRFAELFQRKSFSANVLHACGVQTFAGPTCDKLGNQTVDAVNAVESAEAVRAVRNYNVQAVWHRLRNEVAIRWWRNRIPLTGEY